MIEIPKPRTMKVASFKRHPQNYRTHPDEQLDHIKQSLREHGQYRNVVIARDNTLLAGHGVVEAALALGMDSLSVIKLPIDRDSPQALRLLAGDNEISRLAETDYTALGAILRDIADAEELQGTGYSGQALAALLMVTRPADTLQTFDPNAEWVGMTNYELGEKQTIIEIVFDGEQDREAFCKRIDLPVEFVRKWAHTNHWSIRWPFGQVKDDIISVLVEQA